MDAERAQGSGEGEIYGAKIRKKTPRQSGENIKQITIEAYSERKNTTKMENRNPFDLIFRLLLLLLCAVVFTLICASCRSKQSAIENTSDTIRVTRAREVLRIDTIATTLHDSIFVHEVVNMAGEIQYRERIVYRDKNNVQYKDRVVHDTIYTEKEHNTEQIETTTPPTHGNRWGFSTHQWGLSTISIGVLILITIVYTKFKK